MHHYKILQSDAYHFYLQLLAYLLDRKSIVIDLDIYFIWVHFIL